MTDRQKMWWGAGGLFLLALAVRIISGAGLFFQPAHPDHRQFEIFDSTYHLTRVEKTLETFPFVPFKDPTHYYPDTPDVPWPPGYTLFLATVVKILPFVNTSLARETVLGLVPPLIDALTVALFFLLFRRKVSWGVALLAGGLLALSYQNVAYSEIGYLDHHYFINFLVVILTGLFVFYDERRTRAWAIGLGAWAGAMVFFNVSSIQYALLGLLAAGITILLRRTESSVWKTFPWVLASACGASFLAALSTPAGRAGMITYDQTSLFQFLIIVGYSLFWILAAAQTLTGTKRWGVSGITAVTGLLLLVVLFPDIREGARFLLAGNVLNGIQGEEVPLRVYGHRWYEVFTFFVVFLPFGIRELWKRRGDPFGFTVWIGLFLAHGLISGIAHFLYVQYLFPWYALVVALGAVTALKKLPETLRYAAWVPFAAQVLFSSGRNVLDKKGTGETADREAIVLTVQAFDWLRKNSPSPVPADGGPPTYSVFAHRDHGHMIVRWAQRPVVVSPFSTTAFVDHMKDYVRATFSLDEEVLVSILDRYRSRYMALDFRDNIMVPFLVNVLRGEPDQDAVSAQAQKKMYAVRNNLLFFDGELRWKGTPSIRHFRLVYEVPKVVRTPLQTPQGKVAHSYNALKIFERVAGARLVSKGWPPGERVVARLPLMTNTGRRWLYTAYGRADPAGSVEMVVPYPTEPVAQSGVTPLADTYAVGITTTAVKTVTVPVQAVDRGETISF
jgi:asparagine N-glycosylation enzyme membrane subunit Stt3